MPTPLFRQEALQHAAAGERYEDIFVVVSARAWVALAALGTLLAAAALWSVFGSIPVTVDGSGELIAGTGLATLTAPADGVLVSVVPAERTVARNDAVARIRSSSGQEIVAARTPISGTVIEVQHERSAFVHRGDSLATIEPPRSALEAVVFIPVSADHPVIAGMPARISPIDADPKTYGVIRGKVTSVAPYPATPDRVRSVLHNDALAANLLTGAVREVRIRPDLDAAGELVWSGFPRHRPSTTSGTPASAGVVVDERRPITFIFPALQ